MPIQLVLGYQIDAAMEQIGEIGRQGETLAEHVVSAREIDQEIHVAIGTLLAPGDGAEDADPACAVALPEGEHLRLNGGDFIQQHRCTVGETGKIKPVAKSTEIKSTEIKSTEIKSTEMAPLPARSGRCSAMSPKSTAWR